VHRSFLPRRPLAAGLALAVAAVVYAAVPALAADPPERQRVDLRVLVLNNGSSSVNTIVAQLDREGVPYDTVNLAAANRTPITAATLADTAGGVPRARYNGVVVPYEDALPAAEKTVLTDFERRFRVRQINAYTYAGSNVGLTAGYTGRLDGAALTVTAAGKAGGFGYLAGSLRVEDRSPSVVETYGYLGTPAAPAGATFTPLVTGTAPGTATSGSVMGVYDADGREELVVTVASNPTQTHATLLAHAALTWLTRGVHLGLWRNWFSVHVDDVLLPDDRWSTTANCTVGDDCNPNRDPAVSPYNRPIRMVSADVTNLVSWQNANGMKLDLAYNGAGSVEAGATDQLTASLVANRAQFRWINHTYSHPYLGCVQNFSVVPWRCATDPATGAVRWMPRAEITAEITRNVDWARSRGIVVDPTELVTGEHSGLKSLPHMTTDNPNLGPALTAAGVRTVASDASRESAPRTIGSARTVPRHPMNIFYNVGTAAEEVDEYNWIYTSRADGGSGICEANPATSTCIPPLSPATGFSGYIAPTEARIAFDHVVSADPRPHYAHQSNITEGRILYPVLDTVLSRYRATFTTATPLINPRYSDVMKLQRQQERWRAAVRARSVEAYLLDGRVTVVNRGTTTLDVPITVPANTRTVTVTLGVESTGAVYGEAYGVERSAWKSLPSGGQQLLRLPS